MKKRIRKKRLKAVAQKAERSYKRAACRYKSCCKTVEDKSLFLLETQLKKAAFRFAIGLFKLESEETNREQRCVRSLEHQNEQG